MFKDIQNDEYVSRSYVDFNNRLIILKMEREVLELRQEMKFYKKALELKENEVLNIQYFKKELVHIKQNIKLQASRIDYYKERIESFMNLLLFIFQYICILSLSNFHEASTFFKTYGDRLQSFPFFTIPDSFKTMQKKYNFRKILLHCFSNRKHCRNEDDLYPKDLSRFDSDRV